MRGFQLQHYLQTSRPGSVWAIIILIFVVIGVILYFVDVPSLVRKKDPDMAKFAPWEEWRLREANKKVQGETLVELPDIRESIIFTASAMARNVENTPRGTVNLSVRPDGTISGGWRGNYYNDVKVNFDGGGDFSGYVCPKKIYCDEHGEDRSKLYFITKGKFLLHETDFEKDRFHIRGGDLYVTGWIAGDHTVTGQVTITSDEKYFEAFYWEANR